MYGSNYSGALGDGTTISISGGSPVLVDNNVGQASVSSYATLYLKQDGTLWGMGYNSTHGGLGSGSGTDHVLPIKIADKVRSAQTSAGMFTVFLTEDGTLKGMGYNNVGQLGVGSTASQPNPVVLGTSVRSYAVGQQHVLYVKTDGTLWACGSNQYGQLGIGDPSGVASSKSSFVLVADNVQEVAAGQFFSAFVKRGGMLYVMGRNEAGQLGRSASAIIYPTPISLMSPVSSVAAANSSLLFVKSDGSLWGTGSNSWGQLSNVVQSTSPGVVTKIVASDVRSVGASSNYSYFRKADGSLWAMGSNVSFGTLVPLTSTPAKIDSMVLGFMPSSGLIISEGTGQAPTVTQVPAAQTVNKGASLTLTVQVSGSAPMSYVWRKNKMDLPGERGASLTVRCVQVSDGGDYDVVVTNAAGTTTSSAAKIDVISPPVIAVQPAAPVGLLKVGDNLNLSVTASGYPAPTYQWTLGGEAIGGATNASYSITSLKQSDSGSYRVRATNQYGFADSNAVDVVVNVPAAITKQPVSASGAPGKLISFTVEATGFPAPTFQWYKDNNPVGGAVEATLVISSVSFTDAGQ